MINGSIHVDDMAAATSNNTEMNHPDQQPTEVPRPGWYGEHQVVLGMEVVCNHDTWTITCPRWCTLIPLHTGSASKPWSSLYTAWHKYNTIKGPMPKRWWKGDKWRMSLPLWHGILNVYIHSHLTQYHICNETFWVNLGRSRHGVFCHHSPGWISLAFGQDPLHSNGDLPLYMQHCLLQVTAIITSTRCHWQESI